MSSVHCVTPGFLFSIIFQPPIMQKNKKVSFETEQFLIRLYWKDNILIVLEKPGSVVRSCKGKDFVFPKEETYTGSRK